MEAKSLEAKSLEAGGTRAGSPLEDFLEIAEPGVAQLLRRELVPVAPAPYRTASGRAQQQAPQHVAPSSRHRCILPPQMQVPEI